MAGKIQKGSERTKSAEKKATKPLLKRWWFWLCTVAGVFLLLLTFALPFGVRQYAIAWLEKNGAEQVVIERFGWNPFTGELWVDGVDLTRNGQTVMEHGALGVNVDYASLLTKDLALSSASYTGLVLEMKQQKDGSWQIATITIPASAKTGEAAGGDEKHKEVIAQGAGEQARQEINRAWAFLADDVSIKDCRIHYKTSSLDFTLHIDSAELKHFSTRAGSPAGSLFLQGRINGKAVTFNLHNVVLTPVLQLAGRVEVDHFDLNSLDSLLQDYLPFFGGEASLAGDAKFSLDDSVMEVRYSGNISVADADVGADSFRTRAEKLGWQGKVRYSMPAKGAMEIATDGILQGDVYSLQLRKQQLATSERLVKLSGTTMVSIGDNIEVEHKGDLCVNDIAFTMPTVKVEERSLLWSGAVSFAQMPTGGSDLALDGNLSGEKSEVVFPMEEFHLDQQKINLSAKSGLHFGDGFFLTGESSLAAGSFALYSQKEKNPLLTLDHLAINSVTGEGGTAIGVGRIIGENFSLKTAGDFPLSVTVPGISAEQLLVSDLNHLSAKTFMLKEPGIIAKKNGKNLLTGKSVTLAGIEVGRDAAGTGAMRADHLILERFHLLDKKEGASLFHMEMSGISVSEKDGFYGEELAFTGLSTTIVRHNNGEINFSRQLAAMRENSNTRGVQHIDRERGGEKKAPQEPEEQASSIFPVKLGRTSLSGDSRIAFQDYTHELPYKTTVSIDAFELGMIDTSHPEEKIPVKLMGTVDGRAPLAINGSLSTLQNGIDLDLSLSLKNYALKNLSPYTIESIGVGLGEGELGIKSSVVLKKEVLKNSNQLLLHGLTTETISAELAKELDNRLPVPLNMALSLLRNNSGDIELSVPLKGKLDNLHVGVDDILITALEKAVVSALASYAIYSLGPYGALAYAGMKLGEDLLKEDDLPLIFMPGVAALVDEQKTLLEPYGKELQAQKGDMRICPVVASWELLAKEEVQALAKKSVPIAGLSVEMRQQLDVLGQSRAKNIQHYLVDEQGIDKSRLLLCATVIKEEKKMLPLVILHREE